MARTARLIRTEPESPPTWREAVAELGPAFADRAAAHDAEGTFVAENYAALQERKVFSAGVPSELGGGWAGHAELCELLRQLARYCPSTALVLSMHTHLVATAVWRWRHTGAGEGLLRRVAAEEIGLVSTGASDWVDSNGTMERVEGGYRVSARKVFGRAHRRCQPLCRLRSSTVGRPRPAAPARTAPAPGARPPRAGGMPRR